MTPLSEILRDEIRSDGPISFRRFMDSALYHPEFGYYRRTRNPFGKEGDFYTAEQVQPVFGILIGALVQKLYRAMGEPADFTVVELGPGRCEMEPYFSEWRYLPVDVGSEKYPKHFQGVVFSNEFFDALPVDVAVYRENAFREQRVGLDGDRFAWVDGDAVSEQLDAYYRRYCAPTEDGRWYEASLDALAWMERIGESLDAGWVISIDYGYTQREAVRFARGTLMGYRRHSAREQVLESPGERDITAHVNFTALEAHGADCGLASAGLQTLAQTLLSAGEQDQFAAALGDAANAAEHLRRRMQLKTLLFGMGETFRTLTQRKVTTK